MALETLRSSIGRYGMTRSGQLAAMAWLGLFLSACSPERDATSAAGDAPRDGPAETVQAPPEEIPEPFVLAIDAGRLSVLLGRAREGLEEGAPAVEQEDGDLIRADRELRRAGLELVALRDEICRRGLLTADACVIAGAPSWVFDPPEAAPTAEVIYRRTRELSDAMSPFLEVGCGLGQAPEDGPEFCSVE